MDAETIETEFSEAMETVDEADFESDDDQNDNLLSELKKDAEEVQNFYATKFSQIYYGSRR